MIAYPFMLVDAAARAGMKVPPNHTLDDQSYDREEYPHFWVFCAVQLGIAMEPGEHWSNAEVIAKVPDSEIRTVTPEQLKSRGFRSKGWTQALNINQ